MNSEKYTEKLNAASRMLAEEAERVKAIARLLQSVSGEYPVCDAVIRVDASRQAHHVAQTAELLKALSQEVLTVDETVIPCGLEP